MERFHEVLLSPLETKEIKLVTLPQSGCYYPIDIILETAEAVL